MADSIINSEGNPGPLGGETEAEKGVREARQRRRELIKTIQCYIERVSCFHSETELLNFEATEVKNLDWDVRDFLKTTQELEEAGEASGLRDRLAHEFESLVHVCKARGEDIIKTREQNQQPPSIQLGKSSRSTVTMRSRLSTSVSSEIINDELELAQLQAEAEVKELEREASLQRAEAERQASLARAKEKLTIFKKQAALNAKLQKQQLLGSERSAPSSGKSRSGRFTTSNNQSIITRMTLGSEKPSGEKHHVRNEVCGRIAKVGISELLAKEEKILGPGSKARNVEGVISGAAGLGRLENQIFDKLEPCYRVTSGPDIDIDDQYMHKPESRAAFPPVKSTCVGPQVKPEAVGLSHELSCRPGCPPGFSRSDPICGSVHVGPIGDDVKLLDYEPRLPRNREVERTYEVSNTRKDFLDEAVLIGYDGVNMPYVMFYNQIMNLMSRCPYQDRRLPLLRAACVRTASQTIAVVISDTPGLNDDAKIKMALDRLSQRFGVHGGFANEPEVQKIRHGPKMSSTSAVAWKTFKDELTQCFVFAHSYRKPELLEGRLVVDLARRLPTYAKQRYLDFLSDQFGKTSDPTFDSLMKFVIREEDSKSSDFGVHLMAEERSERASRSSVKNSNCPSVRVKKTSAHIERGGRFDTDCKTVNESIVPPRCFVCHLERADSRHTIVNCRRFKQMSSSERKEVVFKARRCFNCLESHFVKDCQHRRDCRKCHGMDICKHHYLLHDCFVGNLGINYQSNARHGGYRNERSNTSADNAYNVRCVKVDSNKAVLNRIVAARVINPQTGSSKLVYCQQDGGSQLTFVSDKLVQELGLEPYDKASFRIETLTGDTLTHTDLVKLEMQSLFSNETYSLSNVVTNCPWRDDIDTLPHRQNLSSYAHFKDVEMFELPDIDTVDILIGNDNACLMTVLEERVGLSRDEPHAVLTPLGWLGCGGGSPLDKKSVKVCRIQVGSDLGMEAPVNAEIMARDERIRELEHALKDITLYNAEIDSSRSDKDARQFVEAHSVVKDSRYEIPVPMKSGVEEIPNNYTVAQSRLDSLRRKALKDDELLVFLTESFCELQEAGYIELVDDISGSEGPVWYLPYFVTSQAKKRIVYDGSATLGGLCINDFIETGPDLLNSLADILARFRLGKFGLMADLTKCFFQIGLPTEQRDAFRVLWFEKNDVVAGKVSAFRFTRHPWGVKSSPFIASFAIQKALEENDTGASELTRETVRKNIYMDDVIFAVDSLEEAKTIAHEAIALFDSRGFKLVKWSANRDAVPVLAGLDNEVLVSGMRNLDLSVESVELPTTKALGCVWEPGEDRLRIVSSLQPLIKYTRRNMLSQLGKSFDPLGIFSPYFVKARLILQRLAIDKYDWDEAVPESIVKEWKAWFQWLDSLLKYSLPRYYFEGSIPVTPQDRVIYQIHGFSDASNCSYGSVVYLRRIVNGVATVAIVFGRSKVVLRHQESWSIARKELVAAVTTVELSRQALLALGLSECKQYFWSDSRNVLQWIKNRDLRLEKFISRRIEKICLFSNTEDWRYCPTSSNPADVGSRPDSVKKPEARKLWFEGPAFLKQSVEVPDLAFARVSVNRVTFEQKNVDLHLPEETYIDKLIEGAPSLYVLTKRVAYLSAFVDYVVCKVRKREFVAPKLSASDLDKALLKVVGFVQKKVFGQALRLLKNGSPESLAEAIDKHCKKGSGLSKVWVKELRSLLRFRPCVDTEGLLRLEGRLSKSPELSKDMKHPLILPSRSGLTRLVVLHYHENSSHVGVQHTLLCTRKKFWIVNGNGAVKRYLRQCGQCALEKARPVRQLMADLPIERTTSCHKAFAVCGVDYFGYVNYVEGRSTKKAWGLLFTCLASRAVHVEIVTSLSLKDFLLAFSRFNDVRGNVEVIYSDNGSTFQAACKELPRLLRSSELKNALRKKGIRWEFIPPYAPAQGGIWESMVKQIKRILLRTLDSAAHKPSLLELITFCSNSVRVVNERPITALSDDPNDFTVVTPASLLTPGFDVYSPVGMAHERDHLRRDYRFNLALADRFWEDWVAFYLPTLQGRNKWRDLSRNIQIGDLVLVGDADDIAVRGKYRVGRIAEVFPQLHHGTPIVRRAKVAVSEYDRANNMYQIVHIYRDISRIAPVYMDRC